MYASESSPVNGVSEEKIETGTVGNLSWTVTKESDGDFKITFEGNGEMTDYGENNAAPWSEYSDKIKKVYLSENVKSVGDFSFYGFESLEEVYLSDACSSVGDRAFAECSKLSKVENVGNVRSIGEFAFAGDGALKEIELASGLEEIDNGAFAKTGIKKLTIPQTVNSINVSAFMYDSELSEITIPEGCQNISYGAFDGCDKLSVINYSGSEDEWAALIKKHEESYPGRAEHKCALESEDIVINYDHTYPASETISENTGAERENTETVSSDEEAAVDSYLEESAGFEVDSVTSASVKIDFRSGVSLGGKYTDSFKDAAYTDDGGFVAVGYTYSDSVSGNYNYEPWTLSETSHNYQDGLIVKFNADHEVEWTRTIDCTPTSNSYDVLFGVDVLNNGKIVVAGNSSYVSPGGEIKGVSGYAAVIDPKNPDNRTEYHIGGTAGDQIPAGVTATSDGGFTVVGWTASQTGYYQKVVISDNKAVKTYDAVKIWEGVSGTDSAIPNRLYKSGRDAFAVKFNSEGETDFASLENYAAIENNYNMSAPNQYLVGMTVDGNDDIILVGYEPVIKNGRVATVAKLSGKDGSLIWHRAAGKNLDSENSLETLTDMADYTNDIEYSGVTALKDGSYVVTGHADTNAQTEEGWEVVSNRQRIAVRYSSDGEFMNTLSLGTIGEGDSVNNDSESRFNGVLAEKDGGYIIYGDAGGIIKEDDTVASGYDYGNYGGTDIVLLKYNKNNELQWCENYGTSQGDWINALLVKNDGDELEYLAVGESNGTDGNPAWENHGSIDAIVMTNTYYEKASSGTEEETEDGNVIWADGTYEDSGDGFKGSDSVTVSVVIKDHKITEIKTVKYSDTESKFNLATALYNFIIKAQSTDVDSTSGATYSSNGIKEAVSKCLSQAAAAHVSKLIETMDTDSKESVQEVVDSFEELGSYAVGFVSGFSKLESAASANGISIDSKAISKTLTETVPAKGEDQTYNDTYWKLQSKYMNNINAKAVISGNYTGKGVKIAVIDSGLTKAQEDIDYSRVLEGYDYINDIKMTGSSAGDDSEALIDNNGHGTEVTGILIAKTNNSLGITGLLSEAEIVPLRLETSSSMLTKAIIDAADIYGTSVITTSIDVSDTEELKAAVDYATLKGVLITGAVGNSGSDAYIYPASYVNVVAVGSVNAENEVRDNSQRNDQVYVTAPGENIVTTDAMTGHRAVIKSGTSFASPMVASLAAVLKESDPEKDINDFKKLLRESVLDKGDEGFDTSYGYGVIDMKAFTELLDAGESDDPSVNPVVYPEIEDEPEKDPEIGNGNDDGSENTGNGAFGADVPDGIVIDGIVVSNNAINGGMVSKNSVKAGSLELTVNYYSEMVYHNGNTVPSVVAVNGKVVYKDGKIVKNVEVADGITIASVQFKNAGGVYVNGDTVYQYKKGKAPQIILKFKTSDKALKAEVKKANKALKTFSDLSYEIYPVDVNAVMNGSYGREFSISEKSKGKISITMPKYKNGVRVDGKTIVKTLGKKDVSYSDGTYTFKRNYKGSIKL